MGEEWGQRVERASFDATTAELAKVQGRANVRACRVCGCTDDDCRQCIEATGQPCSWVAADLCSRCEMPRWFFTFGVGYDLADAYIVIEAPTEVLARMGFLEARSAAGLDARRGWSSVYSEAEWVDHDARYGPHRQVPIDTPARGSD